MLAGFFSLLTAAAGDYMSAAKLIMLSMVLDGIDGTLARLLRGSTKFGAELDTYVDMLSFGVAPAFLAYLAVLKQFGLFGMLIASLMVLSGVIRLSRFRVKDVYRGQRGYQGLPVTVNAGWIALFIFITESGLMNENVCTLAKGPLATTVWTCSLLFAVLQVSNIRYPKPTKDLIGFLPCLAVVMMLFAQLRIAVAAAIAMSVYGFIYAFITPLFLRHRIVIDDPEEESLSIRHP